MLKGSILTKVRITGYDDEESENKTDPEQESSDVQNDKGGSKKRKHNGDGDDSVSTDNSYVTRFLESSGSSSFLIVRIQSILKR